MDRVTHTLADRLAYGQSVKGNGQVDIPVAGGHPLSDVRQTGRDLCC